MTTKKSVKKIPELKVVFDTSVLYTKNAHYLLNNAAYQLIQDNSSHSDLKVTWYIPEVVMHERQYQMQNRGFDLLPSVDKLEKILGHNLNITENIVESRIKETIENQLRELKIQISKLDTGKVDWNRLTLDAIYRQPPFEKKEKEKGFRDSLIAETYLQIVSSSPSTPKICRIALVADDKLLQETVKNRTVESKNVRILSSLDDLKSLINTLVSEVEEEFVDEIKEQARKYFFEEVDFNTLYFKEEIQEKIKSKFNEKLLEIPEGADRRENFRRYISTPQFLKKTGQRTTWVNQIRVETKAYKYIGFDPETPILGRLGLANYLGDPADSFPRPGTSTTSTGLGIDMKSKALANALASYTPSSTSESLFAKGESIFEVTWSVSVSIHKKFSKPKIENIEFIETTWE